MFLVITYKGKYFPFIYCMQTDIPEIRHELREFLKSNGPTRARSLANHIVEKLNVSEKTVYREIKELTKSGEFKKSEHSRANVEYELVELAKNVETLLSNVINSTNNLEHRVVTIGNTLDKKQKERFPLETLSNFMSCIKQLQKNEARLKILSIYPAIKKHKQFSNLEKKNQTLWKLLVTYILRYNDSKLVNDLLLNFIPLTVEEAYVVNTKK